MSKWVTQRSSSRPQCIFFKHTVVFLVKQCALSRVLHEKRRRNENVLYKLPVIWLLRWNKLRRSSWLNDWTEVIMLSHHNDLCQLLTKCYINNVMSFHLQRNMMIVVQPCTFNIQLKRHHQHVHPFQALFTEVLDSHCSWPFRSCYRRHQGKQTHIGSICWTNVPPTHYYGFLF